MSDSAAIVRQQAIIAPELGATEHCRALLQVYANRGVRHPQEIDYQLAGLAPPNLKDLDRASAILAAAVQNNERILIIGDFDADGATSTALAVRCLRAFGASQVDFLVPNRFEYGYGLTPEIVDAARAFEPQVIVTVDNGVASFAGVARARELGIRVVITDHHLPGDGLPAADALVNPNQPGCEFPSKAAAGVGVVFYVMLGVRRVLRQHNWFAARAEPNLAHFLDLVALGTVADVVPLDYNNRIFVARGLERIRAGAAAAGIYGLLEVAGRDFREIRSQDLGFVVGPRLNAAGRLDDMSIGIQCLLADDSDTALSLARELDQLNRTRRAIESGMQAEAMSALAELAEGELPAGVCLYRADWHQGVSGIVASRIKERLRRPVIVFADDGQGGLKGSGRSVPEVHLRDALDIVAKRHPAILQKFGGHAMAAGLSLAPEHLAQFSQAFAAAVVHFTGGQPPSHCYQTDGELASGEFDLATAEALAAGGPWGQTFPEPVFDGRFTVRNTRVLNDKHLKLALEPAAGGPQVDAIWFNAELESGPPAEGSEVQVVYQLDANLFRGERRLQLLVRYLTPLPL